MRNLIRCEVRKMYLNGYSTIKVANKFDMGVATVYRWCKDIIRSKSEALKGKVRSLRHSSNISKAKKGKKKSFEERKRMKIYLKGINLGQKNGQWKGDKVSYGSLHSYIKYHLTKPRLCQECYKRPVYDLANISQKYKRDLSDWEWLCRSCHMKKDGRLERLYYNRWLRI